MIDVIEREQKHGTSPSRKHFPSLSLSLYLSLSIHLSYHIFSTSKYRTLNKHGCQSFITSKCHIQLTSHNPSAAVHLHDTPSSSFVNPYFPLFLLARRCIGLYRLLFNHTASSCTFLDSAFYPLLAHGLDKEHGRAGHGRRQRASSQRSS